MKNVSLLGGGCRRGRSWGGGTGTTASSALYSTYTGILQCTVPSTQLSGTICRAFPHSVLVRNEGLFKGLYKGLSVTFIKSPITAAISFGLYENLI
jgi:hypothetical protein